jgi:hypothetical protein
VIRNGTHIPIKALAFVQCGVLTAGLTCTDVHCAVVAIVAGCFIDGPIAIVIHAIAGFRHGLSC